MNIWKIFQSPYYSNPSSISDQRVTTLFVCHKYQLATPPHHFVWTILFNFCTNPSKILQLTESIMCRSVKSAIHKFPHTSLLHIKFTASVEKWLYQVSGVARDCDFYNFLFKFIL